jgi:hypothetical protein
MQLGLKVEGIYLIWRHFKLFEIQCIEVRRTALSALPRTYVRLTLRYRLSTNWCQTDGVVGSFDWGTMPYWKPSHGAVKETAEPVVDRTNPNSGNERSPLSPNFESNPRSQRTAEAMEVKLTMDIR